MLNGPSYWYEELTAYAWRMLPSFMEMLLGAVIRVDCGVLIHVIKVPLLAPSQGVAYR